MVLAVPMGRLADRFGRGRVLLGGYALLLARLRAAAVAGRRLARCSSATLGLLGAYYAATDGVLMALGSAVVPDEVRGSGLALLRHGHQHRPAARLASPSARCGRCGASTPRSRASPRRWWRRPRWPRSLLARTPEPAQCLAAGGAPSSASSSASACWPRPSPSSPGIRGARGRPARSRPAPRKAPAQARGGRAPDRRLPRASAACDGGQVAIAPLDATAGKRDASRRCTATASTSPAGRGCASQRGGGFAAGYQRQGLRPGPRGPPRARASTGIPSRARVSPDGRYGAVTLFVTGHAYADAGQLLDADDADRHGAPASKIADLEKFTVTRGGTPGHAPSTSTSGASPSRATATASTPRWPPAARPT